MLTMASWKGILQQVTEGSQSLSKSYRKNVGLIYVLAPMEEQTLADVAEQVAAVHPRHTSCTAVLSLNLICHIMSKHTCCSCPGVIPCQRNVTVADFSPSPSLSLWPHLYHSVLALTSAEAPVNLLLPSFTVARCPPLSPFPLFTF